MSLKTAQEARAGLMEGDLADGKAVQHAKGYSYSMLCELADRLTFVDTTSRPEFVAAVVQACRRPVPHDAVLTPTLAAK